MATTPYVDFEPKTLPRANALQTLWGSGDPERDRRRKNTAKSMISPSEGGEERNQVIYTPKIVLDVIAEVWPEGIALDPCSGQGSLVVCNDSYLIEAGQDGLELPWKDRTYCNPPYKNLKDWLNKAMDEGATDASPTLRKEIIVLCPVRTHRAWFRMAMNECSHIVWLDPLAFNGFKQSFPAPLCLMYCGNRVDRLVKASRKLSRD